MKNVILTNFTLLDGKKDMKPTKGLSLEIEDGKIKTIAEKIENPDATVIDLNGSYLMPGLINLHAHLPSSGKPSKKKLGDTKKLVKFLLSNGLTKKLAVAIEKKNAQVALNSGVTTVRAVGGIGDCDTILRDKINSGKILGPRLIVANTAIGVVDGHMDGTVAKSVRNAKEAVEMVRDLAKQKVDIIKLMITGGVLDGKVPGSPGQLKMEPKIVKAASDEAHKLGLKVAAHVESPEGIKVAIENGVDSIEHGSELSPELIDILKKRDGAIVLTLTPALPLANIDPKESPYGEIGYINAKIMVYQFIDAGKACLEHNVKLGLGTDAGSTYVTHYNTWRELAAHVKYCGVSPEFALYTATLGNAIIAGIENETGSIEVGKSADILIVEKNPLDDEFVALSKPKMVIIKGKIIDKPKFKKIPCVEEILATAL